MASYAFSEPLICAVCAEDRQLPQECKAGIWVKRGKSYIKEPTGRKFLLPLWRIDKSGKIPTFNGPGYDGSVIMTDQLYISLEDIPDSCRNDGISVIPAVPDEDGNFWGYTSVPQEFCELWKNLPTR